MALCARHAGSIRAARAAKRVHSHAQERQIESGGWLHAHLSVPRLRHFTLRIRVCVQCAQSKLPRNGRSKNPLFPRPSHRRRLLWRSFFFPSARFVFFVCAFRYAGLLCGTMPGSKIIGKGGEPRWNVWNFLILRPPGFMNDRGKSFYACGV